MKRCWIAGLAVACTLMIAGRADAAWNNVFQVTCFGCKQQTTTKYLAVQAPVVAQSAPACCPQPQTCTTRYIQRSYYQPVTVMQTKSYYEPVTTYQTSYYYEPVTTYRYSSYYDACSCSYQQVATPVCGYEVRAKSCPVQSWVQRCAQVPVTSYQMSYYWEPQTSCCPAPCPTPCPTPACPTCAPTAPSAPIAPVPQTPAPPNVFENKSASTPPPPLGDSKTTGQQYERSYPPEQGSFQPLPKSIQPITPQGGQQPQPAVKLEKIVAAPEARVEGQVVGGDRAPAPGVKVLFISAQRQATQQQVIANSGGRFQADLPTGDWLVFVSGPDGRQVYHSRIAVGEQPTPVLTLVSR